MVAPGDLPPPATSGTLRGALASSAHFESGSVQYQWDLDEGLISTANRTSSSASLRLVFDVESGTYTVYNAIAGGVPMRGSFAPGQLILDAVTPGDDGFRRLRIAQPETGPVPLRYTSYGIWNFDSTSAQDQPRQVEHFFYFGIPTAEADMPRTGQATFDGTAEGMMYGVNGDVRLFGTAWLSADFAAGEFRTVLTLESDYLGPQPMLLRLNGEGMINGARFSGQWIPRQVFPYEGSILGRFFGPRADEFGYSFAFNNPEKTELGAGVVVGGRRDGAPVP